MHKIKIKIEKLLKNNKIELAVKEIKKLHATEVAEIITMMENDVRNQIFNLLPKKLAAKSFSYLDFKKQFNFLKTLKKTQIKDLLADLSPDDRTELFENLKEEDVEKLLSLLSLKDLEETKMLLNYPTESIGRIMTPDCITVEKHLTVEEVFEHIRQNSKDTETFNNIYIVDKKNKFLDEIKLYKLVLAKKTDIIKDLLDEKEEKFSVTLSPFDDREKGVKTIKKYNRTSLPVVDEEGVFLGMVTVDDLMDVDEEEITEDFHKIGAISHREDDVFAEDLANAPIRFIYKRRISWLLILILVNFFSGAILMYFENIIASTVILVAFLPLLIGSAGNAGAQSSTIIVRALGTGHLQKNSLMKSLSKEFLISALLGISMGLAVSILAFKLGNLQIALTVSLAMVSVVMFGSILGTIFPFVLLKFNKDPATASAPLITSLIDIIGVLIYFSIATVVLGL